MVEALWDGDTFHDWFVLLVTVLDDPAGEGRLATVHHRVGGPPPGTRAAEAGRALADHLGVPFHFASPDVPDDEAPRVGGRPGRASGQGHRRPRRQTSTRRHSPVSCWMALRA
ncbi:hypothetical protein [Streptomyces avermitilis]|uniref:hypothetical protein n=1 Tax=Streptomyces avermitilis TaxID=33903 RepID=UPI0038227F8A